MLYSLYSYIKNKILSLTNKANKYDYEIVDSKKYKKGILKVIKSNNLTNVKSYIYTPYPNKNTDFITVNELKDTHFYLDLVVILSNDKVKKLKTPNKTCILSKYKLKTINKVTKHNKNTHRITILKSSRWKNKEGKYITELILKKEYNFLGKSRSKNINLDAITVLDNVVELLNYRDIKDINFEWEIDTFQKQLMSTNYLK
jgi:hypothetical protein